MHAIEFYTTPSGEVIIKEQGQPERQLKESDTDFIQRFLEVLEEFYPEAYTALRKYRKNVFRKLSIHSMAEFMRYANEKNLFKSE